MNEEVDYSKSVEDLIRDLQRLERVFSKLDETNMPEHTKGFVQGVTLGLTYAIKPPLPSGVKFLEMVAAIYERKYGLEAHDEAESAEGIAQGWALLAEKMKQPDWEERQKRAEKYRHWPDGIVE